MRFCLLMIVLANLSCTTVSKRKNLDMGGGLSLSLPAATEITPPIRAVQVLSVRHQGDEKKFQVVFENQKNQLVLAVLTPLWPTPLRVTYDGQSVRVDRQLAGNSKFDFNYIIADIILVHASLANLKLWMSPNTVITETKNHRVIGLMLDNSLHKLIDIAYQNKDPWQGKVQIKNLERHYEIDIETVKVDYL